MGLTHGSLFTGIGGFDLGFEWAGIRTVFQVEIDEFCRRLLELRFPEARRYSDIRAFAVADAASLRRLSLPEISNGNGKGDGRQRRAGKERRPSCEPQRESAVDIISGGFPCQPVSHAGKRQGANDDRYLWPEMFRVVRTLRPRWVVAENVYGLITHEGGELLDAVYNDLESEGYETLPPVVLPACAFGAPHRRDRVWIVAHSEHAHRWPEHEEHAESHRRNGLGGGGSDVCHSPRGRCEEQRDAIAAGASRTGAECADWWAVELPFCGVASRLSQALDGFDKAIISHYNVGYGKTSDQRRTEEMQAMQEGFNKEKIWGETGGPLKFPSKGVLRPDVHGSIPTWPIPLQSFLETLPERLLREMWEFALTSGSPCEQQSLGQLAGEFDYPLRPLPCPISLGKWETARGLVLRMREAFISLGFMPNSPDQAKTIWESLPQTEKNWASLSTVLGPWHSEWPDVPRVAKGVANRVSRLRGLGNAIVPQISYLIGRLIMECEPCQR